MFCTYCGHKFTASSLICGNCGNINILEPFSPHIVVRPTEIVVYDINDERVIIRSKYGNFKTITITNKRIILSGFFSSMQFFLKDVDHISYNDSDGPQSFWSRLTSMITRKMFNNGLVLYDENNRKMFELKKVGDHDSVFKAFNTTKYGTMNAEKFYLLEKFTGGGFINKIFSLTGSSNQKQQQPEYPLNNFNINIAEPFHGGDEFYQNGKKYFETSDFVRAEFCLNKFCSTHETSLNGLLLYAVILENLSRFEEAIDCYDKALKIKPNLREAVIMKGYSLYSMGRYDEAYSSFENGIKLKSEKTAAFAAGCCLQKKGDLHEAIKKFDLALKFDINNVAAWFNTGICLHELGDYKKAVNCYNTAINTKPGLAVAFFSRGLAYVQMGGNFLKDANESFKICSIKAPLGSDLQKEAEATLNKTSAP